MTSEFWTPQVIASVIACCAWSVFLLVSTLLLTPNLLTRTLCVCAVCGSMTAASAGFLGVTHIAEKRIDDAMHFAATIQRADQLLQEIEQRATATDDETIAVTIAGREVVLTRSVCDRANELVKGYHDAND